MQKWAEWGSQTSKRAVTTQHDKCSVRAVPQVLRGQPEQIGETSEGGEVTSKVRTCDSVNVDVPTKARCAECSDHVLERKDLQCSHLGWWAPGG